MAFLLKISFVWSEVAICVLKPLFIAIKFEKEIKTNVSTIFVATQNKPELRKNRFISANESIILKELFPMSKDIVSKSGQRLSNVIIRST